MKEHGGYRITADVLSDSDMRKQLIADALEDMESFEKKYRSVSELSTVFNAMKEVRSQLEDA